MGEIRVKSRNLATDVHTWERAGISPSGEIVPTPTSSDYSITSDYISVDSSETYTYSHNNGFPKDANEQNPFRVIGWYDEDKNWISRSGGVSATTLTATSPNNAKYARLCYRSYGNLEGCSFVTGSTALPYQPYFLNLPSHQKTSTGWKDIPTHIMTANGWQGELTSQSPLEFRATGQSLLDWRIDGASGGVGDWDETEQKYVIPVNVRGKNLFDIGTSATDYTSPSHTNLTISNDTLSMKLSSESGMTYAVRKQQQTQKGAVTFALDTDCNTGIGIIVRIRDNDDTRWLTSSDTSISGFTYNNTYGGWYKWTPLNNGHPIQAITIPNVGSYYYVGIIYAHSSSTVGNVYSATNIRLLEGTYTSETIPPYEPYINTTTNLYTTSQLMDGDSLGFATDQTTIPITQGDNTLTVGTAVQPSKVFVKFEG